MLALFLVLYSISCSLFYTQWFEPLKALCLYCPSVFPSLYWWAVLCFLYLWVCFFCVLFTAGAAKLLQLCPTLCDPIDGRQPTRLPRPWDSPGKNTGVGCHFLLQCRKVKSESEVSQSCPTLSDPMDCSPPGSSIHGIFQARVLEWGAIAFSSFIH